MKSKFDFPLTRRNLLAAIGAGAVCTTTFPAFGLTAPTKKIVVIGGGMAGATVAKYLRLWSNKAVDVTIVEPSTTYVSNIMSNLVVTGQYQPSILNYNWNTLAANYGIKVVKGSVTNVTANGSGWDVSVSGLATPLACDRVVVAPGISFAPVLDNISQPIAVLHAWQAGPQTTQLRDLLAALPANGTFVMSIPAAPYRCPPGPYERACVIADYLKRNKPGARIVVLDANPDVMAEPTNFKNAFSTLYGANLTYLAGRQVKFITAGASAYSGTVTVEVVGTGFTEAYTGDLLNIIPSQKAGLIAQTLGLCDGTGFAPVNGVSFESTLRPGIHVIGDASKTALPKAGHVGNQGAKICADAILRIFANQPPYATPTANSACYSPLSNTVASWLTAIYQYEQQVDSSWKYVARDQISTLTGATEASSASTGNFSKMNTWYKTLMTETFS
jgi:NADPH-dependent 2,4-dienoyl-CoA reductase/sulfur reductase-like enzyme